MLPFFGYFVPISCMLFDTREDLAAKTGLPEPPDFVSLTTRLKYGTVS